MPKNLWNATCTAGNNCLHLLLKHSTDEEATLSVLHSFWKVGGLSEILSGANAEGETPLHVSLQQPHESEKVIKFLILQGSDPNAKNGYEWNLLFCWPSHLIFCRWSREGATPLCLAYHNANVVAYLIDFGADPALGEPVSAIQLAERDDEHASLVLMKRTCESQPSPRGKGIPLYSELRFSKS